MKENKNIVNYTSTFIFEGNIAVKAAISAKRRKVFKIVVDEKKKDKDTNYILKIAQHANIPIEKTQRETIDAISVGKTHGGLIAYVGERTFQAIDFTKSFYALIEGVEDPYNFAHIIRTLYAAGCNGVILGVRNWNSAADVLVKTSAGASEYMNMIVVDDFAKTLISCKEKGYQIVAGNRKDAISLYDHVFEEKTIMCIGGEMRGLSKIVANLSDINLFIPYNNQFKNALTAVSATSVIAFEYLRQMNKK